MNLQDIIRDVNMKVKLKQRYIKGVDVFAILVLVSMVILLFTRFQSRCS
jgi:hypothetical protein